MMQDADIGQDQALLSDFAEFAMDLARDLHAAAKAETDPTAKARLAQEFSRAGRSLRQTVLVKARLRKEVRDIGREGQARAAEARQVETEGRKAEVRRRVARIVVETIDDADQVEEVKEELEFRLADYARELETRPLPEVMEEICKDLGIRFAPGERRPWDKPAESEPAAPAEASTGPPDNPWT